MTDKTDVVKHEPDPFLEMVKALTERSDIDADKVEKFLDMQERILDREAKTEFFAAMNRVQAELPVIEHDKLNKQTGSMYARLEQIVKTIKPIYTKHGFSASFTEAPCAADNYIRVEGALRHKDGHVEDHYWTEMPLDKTGIKGTVNKTDIHATGSAFKYARRYLTCLMFDVATADYDDDANAAEDPLWTSVQARTKAYNAIREAAENGERDDLIKHWREGLDNDQKADLWGAFTKDEQRMITNGLKESDDEPVSQE